MKVRDTPKFIGGALELSAFARRSALFYLAGASAWIFLSDLALSELTLDLQTHAAYGMVKGALFVLVTSALLYWVLLRQVSPAADPSASVPAASGSTRGFAKAPVAAFGALGLVVIFAAILIFTLESRQRREEAQNLLASSVAQEAGELEMWLNGKRAVARSYRGARALRDQLVVLGKRDDPIVRANLTARLEDIRQNLEIDAVLILDAGANLVAASGEPRFHVLSRQFREHSLAAHRSGELQAGFLHRGRKSDGGFVFIDDIVPLPAVTPGEPSPGTLVLRENAATRFFRLFEDVRGSSRSAEAVLVRRAGDQVQFLSNLRFREDAALNFSLPLSTAMLRAAQAIQQGGGVMEGTDYRGVEVMAAARAIAGTDWTLIAKIDRDEVLAKARRSVLGWLLAIAGIGALAAFGVVTLLRQQRTLAALREQALSTERAAVEKHLDLMSRYANDAILLLDNDGRIVEANERVADMYGYSAAQIAGTHISKFRSPQEESEVAQRLERIWQTGSDVYEALHVHRDGRTFPVEISSRRIDAGAERYIQTIIRDISARKAAEASLRESEATYRTLFDGMLNGVAYCKMLFEEGRACDWVYVSVNKAFEAQTGLRGAVGRRVSEVIPGIREADPGLFEIYERLVTTGKSETFTIFVASLQQWFQIAAHRPKPEHFVAVFDVVTARKEAEARIQRLSQMKDALSGVNKAIVHLEDERELYREVCRVIAERADFRLAWIGIVDPDTGQVRPVAQAGAAAAYVSAIRVSLDDRKPEGRGLIAQAIRSASAMISQDFANDPRKAPWHEEARQWGLGSMAAVPLRRDGIAIGTLNVYAHAPRAFDAEYLDLLLEMAGDISFALAGMDRERELRASEMRFRAMLEQTVAAIFVIQDGKFTYANPHLLELLGYRPEDPFDPDALAHVAQSDRARMTEAMAGWLTGAERAPNEFLALRRDGGLFRFGVSMQRATYLGKPAIIGIGQDITEKQRIEAERSDHLRRAEAHLAALTSVTASAHLVAGEVEDFARELTETAAQTVGVERANVWLFDDAETELRCIDLYEATPGRHSAGATLSQAQFGPEFAALKANPYVDANEPLTDPRTAGYAESYLKPLGITSMLDAVVRFSGKNLGLLCLEHVDRAHRWHRDEIAFACQLADKLALAIINRGRRQAKKKLRQSLEASIAAIAATLEMRDPYTAGHERRVAELAAAIATEMALSPFVVEGIHFGAMIHDLGKIQIPAEILSKPTRISPVEFELIKGHAQAGYDILKGIDFPWPVAEMARQHHERVDGSGYPQGLKGEEILLEARVLAVADVVEAMASHRPYRAGLGIDKALAEIERGRGTAYDAQAADACLRLFREKSYKLPD